MTDVLIKHAKIVNEGKVAVRDVLIEDNRIKKIGKHISALPEYQVIDAEEKHLLPGMIDSQVDVCEPGSTGRGDIRSESRAAVAGGVTSFFVTANSVPPTTSPAALEAKYELLAKQSMANFACYIEATDDTIEMIKTLSPDSVCAIAFDISQYSNAQLLDAQQLPHTLFSQSAIPLSITGADAKIVDENRRKYKRLYGDSVPMSCHPEIYSREACLASTSLAIQLARQLGAQVHLPFLSTEEEVDLLVPGNLATKNISAGTTVSYLWFSDHDYAHLGQQIKVQPAIKATADQDALLAALQEDRVDIISSGHVPHVFDDKQKAYFSAAGGVPMVQHALLAALELYHRDVLTLPQVVAKTSHNVATRFKIKDRGFIREGCFADLVLVDLSEPTTVNKRSLKSKCGWSPLEGAIFKSSIDMTIVNGEVRYQDGKLSRTPHGRRLEFDRQIV